MEIWLKYTIKEEGCNQWRKENGKMKARAEGGEEEEVRNSRKTGRGERKGRKGKEGQEKEAEP